MYGEILIYLLNERCDRETEKLRIKTDKRDVMIGVNWRQEEKLYKDFFFGSLTVTGTNTSNTSTGSSRMKACFLSPLSCIMRIRSEVGTEFHKFPCQPLDLGGFCCIVRLSALIFVSAEPPTCLVKVIEYGVHPGNKIKDAITIKIGFSNFEAN